MLKWLECFSLRWVSFRGQVVKRKPSHTLHQHCGMRGQRIYWAVDFQWAYKLIGGWTCPRSNDFKVIAGSVNNADLHCISLIADLTNEQFRGIQAWTLFHVPWMACQRSLFLTSFIFVQSALNLYNEVTESLIILSFHPQSSSVPFVWSWNHILACLCVCVFVLCNYSKGCKDRCLLKQGKWGWIKSGGNCDELESAFFNKRK